LPPKHQSTKNIEYQIFYCIVFVFLVFWCFGGLFLNFSGKY